MTEEQLTFRTACHLLMSDEAVFAAFPVFFFFVPSKPAPTGALSAGRFLSSLTDLLRPDNKDSGLDSGRFWVGIEG